MESAPTLRARRDGADDNDRAALRRASSAEQTTELGPLQTRIWLGLQTASNELLVVAGRRPPNRALACLSGVGRAAARPEPSLRRCVRSSWRLAASDTDRATGRGTRIRTGTGGVRAETKRAADRREPCARPRTRSDAGRLKSSRLCCTASSIQWCAGPSLAVQAVRRLRCCSTSERAWGRGERRPNPRQDPPPAPM